MSEEQSQSPGMMSAGGSTSATKRKKVAAQKYDGEGNPICIIDRKNTICTLDSRSHR